MEESVTLNESVNTFDDRATLDESLEIERLWMKV
jgi:hypothetical protein